MNGVVVIHDQVLRTDAVVICGRAIAESV